MKSEKNFLRIINALIILAIIGSPFFYWRTTVYPYTFSKTIFFQVVVEILFFFWLGLVFLNKKYRPKLTPLVLAGGIFFLVLLITSITGIDFWRSFWATIERAFGVFALLHFGALALVISSLRAEINFRKILYWSLGMAVVISGVALIQLTNPYFLMNEGVGSIDRPGATFGNPSFLAGYLTFHIFIAFYFLAGYFRKDVFFRNLKKIEILFLSGALVLNTVVLFQTQTRGDILGLGLGLFVLLLMFTFRGVDFKAKILGRRVFYGGILALLVVLAGGFWVTRSNDFWNKVPGLSRFKDISLEGKDLAPRLSALEAGWKGFKEKPVLGWGWDNFNVVYNKHYDPKILSVSYSETRFDKPHNYLLEYLVAGGIPLFLAYLSLIFLAGYQALKIKDRLLSNIFIAFVASYFVRGFFLFETLGPFLVLFLFLAWIDNQYKKDKNLDLDSKPVNNIGKQKYKEIGSWGIWLGAPVILIFIYFANISGWRSNHYEYSGFNYFSANRPKEAIASFKKAVEIWSPYRWFIERDYAAALTEAYFYNPELIPKEEVILALKAMEDSTSRHPRDAYGHYALVDMYNQAAEIDPENYVAAAERHGAIALELSPNRQQVLFSLAKTKSLKNDIKGALEISKKALDLNPEVADAHFYYGLFLHVDGQTDLSYEHLKRANELGRKWKNFNEPLVVGNFFADSGRLEEAIELYKVAEKMDQNALEVKMKLGIAYYFNDQKDLAKEKILEVMKVFDLTKSDVYESVLPILRDLDLVN